MALLVALVTVFTLSFTSQATCYFPNGAVSGSDTACNPNAIESACCFHNQACLSNGLCVSDPHNATIARTHRGTCTDQAWNSGNCPQECLDINNNGVPVYSCNSTTSDEYCCFDNCQCNSRFETFSFAGVPADVYTVTIIGEEFTQTQSSTSSVLSSVGLSTSQATIASTRGTGAASAFTKASFTDSTSSNTAMTETPTTSVAPGFQKSSSSKSTAIGVGVGVGVGVGALIVAGLFFFCRRRRSSNNPYQNDLNMGPVAAPGGYYSSKGTRQEQFAHYAEEPSKTNLRAELPARSFTPTELPASPLPKPHPSMFKEI